MAKITKFSFSEAERLEMSQISVLSILGEMETKRTDHRTTFQMVHEPEESSVPYNVNMELIDKYSIVLNS
jgi:hypothetical protein